MQTVLFRFTSALSATAYCPANRDLKEERAPYMPGFNTM